jgi:hypothetical protein
LEYNQLYEERGIMINKKWLKEQGACSEGYDWFSNKYKDDGIAGDLLVEVLIKDEKLDWANWLIIRIMSEKQCRVYAVYAAEQVAYLWKDKYPKEYKIWKKWVDDGCPDNGRAAARAARDAAWDAARSAAWDAARSAAWDAAWDAARSAAWDAARSAARDAAWAAARDAAGDAARSAAWDAAWDAARSAAWDAARSAARDAAWAAARDAAGDVMLTKILRHGLKILKDNSMRVEGR